MHRIGHSLTVHTFARLHDSTMSQQNYVNNVKLFSRVSVWGKKHVHPQETITARLRVPPPPTPTPGIGLYLGLT